jgi:hypothetical protein
MRNDLFKIWLEEAEPDLGLSCLSVCGNPFLFSELSLYTGEQRWKNSICHP